MKIYDISQEVFSCNVFPGDPGPKRNQVLKIAEGATCNMSEMTMGVHNGTHMDAPYHFLEDGKTMDEIDLHKVLGDALVVSFDGELGAEDVKSLIPADAPKRILFKGKTELTLEAAKMLNQLGLVLAGVESQSVGDGMIHVELLGKEMVLLEGIRLGEVPDGKYFLIAVPLKLCGCDGSPCRPVLIDFEA